MSFFARHTLWEWPGWPGTQQALPLGGVWCPRTHTPAVTLLDPGPGHTPYLQGALWVCLKTALNVNIKGTDRGTAGMHWVLPLSSPLPSLILQPGVALLGLGAGKGKNGPMGVGRSRTLDQGTGWAVTAVSYFGS